jgi:hypothetical protein
MKKHWMELWWKMAGGLKSEYDQLLATDIFDFWTLYDLWLDRIKDENARRRSQANKR